MSQRRVFLWQDTDDLVLSLDAETERLVLVIPPQAVGYNELHFTKEQARDLGKELILDSGLDLAKCSAIEREADGPSAVKTPLGIWSNGRPEHGQQILKHFKSKMEEVRNLYLDPNDKADIAYLNTMQAALQILETLAPFEGQKVKS